jgi:hypothetical protein
MIRFLKWLFVIGMIVGVTLAILNFISIDNMAERIPGDGKDLVGTWDPSNRRCAGAPLNC